ncbi:maleylpyruvate isomerase family mycothiol-dependent enzyme [Zhihengliuella flava]|uniref:Maleylpyruvate isomerase n=1 Tax=Zhihengliuella flava TaxID=1285193 RepID=A0A931DCU3_9MICC|nr:maleylpyruvate isomerase family mycothiol-dependent enzyme [Zhihengliuella flava]MBG6084503.1 maleylpyruvate isomerase [Zhihengliuella flava]
MSDVHPPSAERLAEHYRTADPGILEELAGAHRAASFFTARVNELRDSQLAGDSLLPGWTRAHVVAHVGYNAYALARLATWAETGVETPMYASAEARDAEIEAGSAMEPGSLHFLNEDAQRQLEEHWQRLDDAAWNASVRTRHGAEITARTTLWMRARELWLHAVDLNNGTGAGDLPEPVLERLLANVQAAWADREESRALRLLPASAGPDGSATRGAADAFAAASDVTVVTGPLPELTAWATGRSPSTQALTFDGAGWNAGSAGPAPRWL